MLAPAKCRRHSMAKPKPKRYVVAEPTEEESVDILVPDPQVWTEFGVTSMTLYRWTRDPKLNFPQPVKINGRCYRRRREIEAFKERLLRQAIATRASQAEAS